MEEAGLSIITEGNEPPTPSSELLMHLAAMLCFTLLISLHIVSIAVDLSPDAFISAMENNCTGHENALQEDSPLNDLDNNPPGNNSPTPESNVPEPESNPPEPDSNPPEPESNPQQQSHNHPASNAQQQGNNAAESNAQQQGNNHPESNAQQQGNNATENNAQQQDNKQQQADANANASTNTGQMVDDDPIKVMPPTELVDQLLTSLPLSKELQATITHLNSLPATSAKLQEIMKQLQERGSALTKRSLKQIARWYFEKYLKAIIVLACELGTWEEGKPRGAYNCKNNRDVLKQINREGRKNLRLSYCKKLIDLF